MQSRRKFIGDVATGLAGSIATGRAMAANDRIRFGVIGMGERGTQLAREAMACGDTELVAFADIYARRLEDSKNLAPGAAAYSDYHELLEDSSIDAVLIATPQHLHGESFIAAMNAGRHVYQEKTMAFTIDEAKAMRAAYVRAGKKTVQIGHQACSSGQIADAANYLRDTGLVTMISAEMWRNSPQGKAPWSRPLYPDMTEDTIRWKSFLGSAPDSQFDPHQFANWRLFRQYSGGNVFENMCQQIAFWYKAMGLQIPSSVNMSGGLFLWKDGRDIPDTMTVSMEHAEDLLITWNSGFGNSEGGIRVSVAGTHGTILRGQQIRFVPQKVNRPSGGEMLGQTPTAPRAHMRNFLDCIRSGKEPNCPFELGYRVSIACRMAMESYFQERRVRWDAIREELV